MEYEVVADSNMTVAALKALIQAKTRYLNCIAAKYSSDAFFQSTAESTMPHDAQWDPPSKFLSVEVL
jgi:hypothetical protein